MRGVKSGLPLIEALKVVAAEAPEPVESEFLAIVESLKVGVTLGEACGACTSACRRRK